MIDLIELDFFSPFGSSGRLMAHTALLGRGEAMLTIV